MQWTCLIVDLTESDLADTWQDVTANQQFAMELTLVTTSEEAKSLLEKDNVLVLVVFANENSGELQSIFKSYQKCVGCLSDFQAIVCDDPAPAFMAGVFEFGIEQFFARKDWLEEAAALSRRALETINDESSPEFITLKLSRSIRSSDQEAIHKVEAELGDMAEYDFRAAYAKGRAREAVGDYTAAVDAFASAKGMNKMFRPSSTSLGETLLVAGRIDEALVVFKEMERTNPYDVDRKANIASAYVEKGDFESAMKYVEAANKLAPDSSRVLEAKAQVMLCTGKVGEAFKLMDSMSEVGPFFAAKMNDLGIKLSQAGKGKSALALYKKAHKIVRPELRYKISLNAALACRRLKAWDMALKYLVRCEQEYGSSFPKLDKIKKSVVDMKSKRARAGQKQAS